MARTLKPQKPMSSDAEAYSAEAFRLSREVQRNTRVELDVAYGPYEEQGLDLYFPADVSSTPLPTLLFMHGGGGNSVFRVLLPHFSEHFEAGV